MRKQVVINKTELGKIGYQAAPLKQILNLDLNTLELKVLLNFFSNADTWELSFNSISNAFYTPNNRSRIKSTIESLVNKGYISNTEKTYTINLGKIQSDYKVNITKTGTDCNSTDCTSGNSTTDTDCTNNTGTDCIKGVVQIVTGVGTDCTSLPDTDCTNNKRNNKEIELKEENKNNSLKAIEILDFSEIDLKLKNLLIEINVHYQDNSIVISNNMFEVCLIKMLSIQDNSIVNLDQAKTYLNNQLLNNNIYYLDEVKKKLYKGLDKIYNINQVQVLPINNQVEVNNQYQDLNKF